ncbi:MAG TPA: VOC family protein [Acidimicrobiia bacterium]|nr:VOC family protein [Acidimicrobiia bacterium]
MEVKDLGHIVLYVSDLERSRKFYAGVLGFRELATAFGGRAAVYSSASGRTHHELLLIEVGAGAHPVPEGRRLGMYHFGLKIGESDDELRAALAELDSAGVTVVGTSDHGVTHSAYIVDPDGNEIELYIDVQPERWRVDPAAIMAPIKPLVL